MNRKENIVSGFFWRFLERCGAHGVTFIVSIVLARLLNPSVYGTIALVTVFTTIMQVFVDSGIPLSELAEILPTLNRISSWIEAVFAFVSSEAINHGVAIPGYKVVEGRSKRVFTDTKAVVDTAVANGYTDLYKQSLMRRRSLTAMFSR